MKKIIVAISLSLLICASAVYAQQPSAKATFAYKDLIALGGHDVWHTILTQEIKMANAKDLFIDASLQCGIVTDTTVKSMNGVLATDEARATVRVRIALFKDDVLYAYAQPDRGRDAANADDPDAPADPAGVVFCDRIQTLLAKFSGLNCTADLETGAVTCDNPEELQLILKTLNANSFNFVAADLEPGVYTIKVQAKTTAVVGDIGIDGALNKTNAFVGAGSVAIESVRMIKDEQVEF